MQNLKELSFSDVKAIYDFFEIRKGIISNNPEHFEEEEIHVLLNKQKIVWHELHNRIDNIQDLIFNTPMEEERVCKYCGTANSELIWFDNETCSDCKSKNVINDL